MTMKKWETQVANDPDRGFELYLELLEGNEPRGWIERAEDGELYFGLFACPEVRVPFRWLVSIADRAETLPVPGKEDE